MVETDVDMQLLKKGGVATEVCEGTWEERRTVDGHGFESTYMGDYESKRIVDDFGPPDVKFQWRRL